MAGIIFPQKSLMKQVIMTVKTTGVKEFKIRIAIGIMLVELASMIMCVGIKIDK